jgi:hypothetical protein
LGWALIISIRLEASTMLSSPATALVRAFSTVVWMLVMSRSAMIRFRRSNWFWLAGRKEEKEPSRSEYVVMGRP